MKRRPQVKISLPYKSNRWISRKSAKLILFIIVTIVAISSWNSMLSAVVKTTKLHKIISDEKVSSANLKETETRNMTVIEENNDKNLNFPEDTHPLENLCKYAILHPWDESLMGWMKDNSNMTCERAQPNIIKFQSGKISVDQENATKELNFTVDCKYRPLGGTLWPSKNIPVPIGEWVNVTEDELDVWDDQIEVQCFEQNGNESHLVYRFAFAHVVPKFNKTFAVNTEDRLSLNIVKMDSVSRNAFRRHMPLSFEYLTKDLKAFDFQGFMKVADNTLPNLLPILTGLRYLNLSDDMLSDIPLGKPVDLDALPLIWKEFQDKGCATMLNVDPVMAGFGFLQYPTPEFNGFHSWPTDYWFRPFYIFNRKFRVGLPNKNVSKLRHGNKFGFDYQLEFHEQMSMMYNNTCSRLELMDLKLKQLVERLYNSNALNKTIIIMGDHGQRVNWIRYEFIGRIEERMPLFTIVFPEWFRKKYPSIMNNLRLNQNRLISNFDLYHILKNVADANFDGTQVNSKFLRQTKGLSPLHNFISKNRTCKEANIPENHCACLIPDDKKILSNDTINGKAYVLIKNYTQNALESFAECEKVVDIELINVTRWTMNQMVQHGVRLIEKYNEAQQKILKKNVSGNVEFIEVEYVMLPMNFSALIRIQNVLKHKLFFVISDPPLILNGKFGCKDKSQLPSFCKCINN